jgi:hypothetical protein
MRNKRIYQFYHRLRRIRKEVRKKYHADLFCYAYYKPDENMDMDEFLKLRDEANKLFNIIYNKEYKRCVKYVKGGGTFFYTPMKKKERRKALRKIRLQPIGYFLKIYEDDQASYSIKDQSTKDREIPPLVKYSKQHPDWQCFLISYDEETTEDGIDVIPVWKWLLS